MKVAIAENLQAAGIILYPPPDPGGSYVSVNVRARIAYVAVQFPIKNKQFLYQGVLGENISSEEGYEAAKICAVNILSQINEHVGFTRILGLNHLDIYFQQSANWDDGAKVANGASDLFMNILENKGLHSRAIFGVQKLPRNFCVGITSTFTID